jgi:hypothetical protein
MRGLLLLGILCATSVQARILDVHSEIRVAKSGELTVTERITVDAQATAIALERDIPDAALVVDVIRDGHPESYLLDGARLRVGGTPPAGRHLYQITYRSARRIAFLADHDALHWNVKGGERITAEVILPASVPRREIKVEGRGTEYQSFVRDGRAAFRAQDSMSLVVRFPKGVVTEPAIGQRAQWFFSDYYGLVLVALLLAFSSWVLFRLKRHAHQLCLGLVVACAALALSGACRAETGQFGINLYGASYHLERDRAEELGLDNEFNPGIGVRYRQPYGEHIDWLYDAGVYRDSTRNTALVVGAGGFWKATESLRLGAAIALFKSETYNEGNLALAPLPIAAWETRSLSFNAAFAPRLPGVNEVSTLSFWLTYWP